MQFPGMGGRRTFTKEDARQTLSFINLLGFTYFWSSLGVFFYATVFVYIPALYRNDPETEEYRLYLAVFILAQVLANYLLCMFTNSHFKPNLSEAIPNSLWTHCLDCDAPKPPKTHHCPSCRRCILKRDHHCFLTMHCIGFTNLRYMIIYCFWSAFAAGYTYYLSLEFCKLLYQSPFSWDNWHHYVFPFTALEVLLGRKTWQFLAHVGVLYWSGVTAFCGTGFGSMQLVFAIFNMTQRDVQQGRLPDCSQSQGLFHSLRKIFGPWPLLNFILPLPCFKPEGDGIHESPDSAAKLI